LESPEAAEEFRREKGGFIDTYNLVVKEAL
jgi:hypothetical protein